MSDSIRPLVERVRAGDARAAEELVRRYDPEVRRAVRVRLADPRLQGVLDSMDICQSVLANFFARAAAGQFDLDSPEQLLALLVTMARNKLRAHARRQAAAGRDRRRLAAGGGEALGAVAAAGETPSEAVAGAELLREVLN